jgi:mannose-6-phosphate isomerase-like protein (cupin superfamily)
MAQGSGYRVKEIEPVMLGRDVQVRLLTLAPGEAIPWHHHSTVTDWYFVLEGRLAIETRPDGERRLLQVGASHKIPPGTPHQISNPSAADTRFLLVQGVGAYDFVRAES